MGDFSLGTVRIYNDVSAGAYNKHGFYQFVQHCEDADRKSVEEAARVGADVARRRAPRGKTGDLKGSIYSSPGRGSFGSNIRGTTWAEIHVGTDHWRFVNYGTPPHDITGMVNFFWDKKGRAWKPGHNVIKHPGSTGRHFMWSGMRAAEAELPQAMRRNYAGI